MMCSLLRDMHSRSALNGLAHISLKAILPKKLESQKSLIYNLWLSSIKYPDKPQQAFEELVFSFHKWTVLGKSQNKDFATYGQGRPVCMLL